ncbi:MAG TPA: 2OG-Fe(II) oxygenase, partial [Candidatus Polarisedimenticolia bacterium]|nr:2OG-Fe(II) oxygenase [Candidatus Polarisedimenticolia bacterium]
MSADFRNRIDGLDWKGIESSLEALGHAVTPPLLTPEECAGTIALYGDEGRFRSRIDMARHRFGVGEYKYFADPLPPLVRDLRLLAYARLAPIANRWRRALGGRGLFPATLPAFLRRCARHG